MQVHENQSLAHNSNPTSTHEMIFTQETVGGIGSVGVVEDLELVVRRDDLGTTLSKSRSGALDDGLHVCSSLHQQAGRLATKELLTAHKVREW